ncbi:MAG TPA: class I SAM-dependent methyltransferase [Candidatus Nanoarchaeia archaeon]|nr:class I SAM-dependent methyltransferase [Candidatus Nanoarchaeia archaeon]
MKSKSWGEEYYPKPNTSRLKNVGDVVSSRNYYYHQKPPNLIYLLKNRYMWMNRFINPGDKVLELGCGIGVSKDFLRPDAKIILTDLDKQEWVDQVVDAENIKLEDGTYDAVICSNMIHHLSYPAKFLKEVRRILKPKGRLIIQEVNFSTMCKLMTWILRTEGWSYRVDPFDEQSPCKPVKDPWQGNNAVPNLLFDDKNKFHHKMPFFQIVLDNPSEFMLFPLSGGVTNKAKTINLPESMLKIIERIDNLLIELAPNFFALQRKIVLVKNK